MSKMPVLFVGHGNPMLVLEDNEITRAWATLGQSLKPRAILAVSAHWVTRGTLVTSMQKPRIIYDFYGFPDELYQVTYPAPGSPELALRTASLTGARADEQWGLDHGTWCVLKKMFPNADIPVVQLSLDAAKSGEQHMAIGRELRELRNEGVLILASGNIVHNLGAADFSGRRGTYEWATRFDNTVTSLLDQREFSKLCAIESLGNDAALSAPTPEHYWPLLYALGAAEEQDRLTYPVTGMDLASISMRSVMFSES